MLSQLVFSGLLALSLATQQLPLKPEKQSLTPFDDVFNEKVDWVRDHFGIPGLAIAVIDNETIYSKVNKSPQTNPQPTPNQSRGTANPTSRNPSP